MIVVPGMDEATDVGPLVNEPTTDSWNSPKRSTSPPVGNHFYLGNHPLRPESG